MPPWQEIVSTAFSWLVHRSLGSITAMILAMSPDDFPAPVHFKVHTCTKQVGQSSGYAVWRTIKHADYTAVAANH
jgi:hypothetical protein